MRALEPMPIQVQVRGDEQYCISGLPPVLMYVLQNTIGPHWARSVEIQQSECRCRLKMQVVPGRGVLEWWKAMQRSLVGAQSVVAAATYLGVAAACPRPLRQDLVGV